MLCNFKEVTKIQEYFNTLFKNFQDNNIEVVNCSNSDSSIIIQAKLMDLPFNTACPNCGSADYTKHGIKLRSIKHINIGNKPIIINLSFPRLLCKDCHKTFNPDFSFVEKGRRMSKDLCDSIIDKTSKKVSLKDIANNSNVSETTISNELKKQVHAYRCSLTEIICIDEFKASTIAGTYALIIGDPMSGKILDILPTRTQDYIIYYLQTLNKDEVLGVKYVVTDLYEAYRTIIKANFTNATHIADRFHVIRLLVNAFNNIRIKTMNSYLKKASFDKSGKKAEYLDYAKDLKKYHKFFIKNRYKHEPWEFDKIVSKDKKGNNLSLNTIIEKCINYDEDLEEAYKLLQSFYYIFKYSNFDRAKNDILEWIDNVNNSDYRIQEIRDVALTYKSWIKEIVNSFIINPITHQKMTNGFIEGKNNFVKTIKRVGFGYKDFDLFRIRILNCDKNQD